MQFMLRDEISEHWLVEKFCVVFRPFMDDYIHSTTVSTKYMTYMSLFVVLNLQYSAVSLFRTVIVSNTHILYIIEEIVSVLVIIASLPLGLGLGLVPYPHQGIGGTIVLYLSVATNVTHDRVVLKVAFEVSLYNIQHQK